MKVNRRTSRLDEIKLVTYLDVRMIPKVKLTQCRRQYRHHNSGSMG
jgi:hypothetical protein